MAASSPAPSNNSTDTTTTTVATTPTNINSTTTAATTAIPTTTNGVTTPQRDAPKNLRGLNKPKCSQCGNVARSRCPYQSCKSCCAKAQNPCHIHVLKANATFPDKTPSSSSPLFDQQSTDVSSTGASLRASSFRQLSQFSGAQVPLRAKRPLTRKDAAAINQWRFAKLKEYKDSNIEAENEAFDRYMQNVSLLEEAFFVNSSLEGLLPDVSHVLDSSVTNGEGNTERMISVLKARLRSNLGRAGSFRQRIRDIVDLGLMKLQKWEFNDEGGLADTDGPDGQKELRRPKKAKNWRAERTSAVNDLIDKLNKARSEEDLQFCLGMKSQLFNQHEKSHITESKNIETSMKQNAGDVSTLGQDSDYILPRPCTTVEINQEILHTISKHYSSHNHIDL